jgi:YfiR/HmsC-like
MQSAVCPPGKKRECFRGAEDLYCIITKLSALKRYIVNIKACWNRLRYVEVKNWLWFGFPALVLTIFCSGRALGQFLPVASVSDLPPSQLTAPALSAPNVSQGRDVRSLAALINGIISYTRWPQPPNPIRICVLGRDDLVAHLQAGAAIASQRPITVQGIKSGAGVKNNCDVAYVSALPPENAMLLLGQTLVAPIVTIGEGAEFCSDGGMFCIELGTGPATVNGRLRFSANLDVISRSGLRINPHVLLLSRQFREQQP